MKKTMLRKSSGVALVTAIFLLVVLAGLGVAVVALTTTQRTTSAQDELGARAYQAAKAGLEWALFRQLRAGGCPASTTFAMPRNTTLSGFTVTVTCDQSTQTGFGTTAPDPPAGHFLIVSTACNGPSGTACPAPGNSPDYIQRVVRAQL